MDNSGFLSLWKAEPLEKSEVTDKLYYRIMGGYKFQFHKGDYRERTSLLIAVSAACKELIPIYEKVIPLLDEDENTLGDMDLALKVLPDIIAALATPGLQELVDRLCFTAKCDIGNGAFEALDNPVVAEKVFGPDISLQIPVALTALNVNLDTAVTALILER